MSEMMKQQKTKLLKTTVFMHSGYSNHLTDWYIAHLDHNISPVVMID